MHFSLVLHALVVPLLLLWTDSAAGHSVAPRPLKRVANPSTLALEILPRKRQPSSLSSPFSSKAPLLPRSTILRFDDSFRLTIAAFDDVFHLHLRPNDNLIHPAARIKYYSVGPDGESYVSHTKPLLRESVKAFMGEVIHSDYSESRMRQDAAGAVPVTHPSELGWARIMVHHQGNIDAHVAPVFEGAFSVKGVVYHVATKDNYHRNKRPMDADAQPVDIVDSELVIWRESDVMTVAEERIAHLGLPPPVPQTCAHDKLSYNTDPNQNPILVKQQTSPWFESPLNLFAGNMSKRDDVVGTSLGSNFVNNIGQTAGCPTTQKVLYMGVAADCEYVTNYGGHDNATTQILNDWNSASSLYRSTFNVSLGIVELQIQSEVCPNPVNASFPWNVNCSTSLNDRLSLFSQWRGDKGPDGAGLWHLMSGCPTGSEVGIAWLATLCQQSATGNSPSVVSGTAVSTAGLTEWQVVAHEIGHNFGAIHDCTDGCNSTSSCCPLTASTCDANSGFLMSPVAGTNEKTFSQCTIGNVCSLMTGTQRTNTTCLQDPSSSIETISLQMCGNGIVESGEQCDPGEGVDSPCCDSTTCKFKNGAVCDPDSSPCCTNQCTFAPSTQVCRPAISAQCDYAETCTGNSSSCPADVTAPNGQSCGSGGLTCASGQCTSVSQQCQMLGASMNLSQACPNQGSTCQVSCQDPTEADQCIVLTALLVDGSPCGYGGRCYSGTCQSSGLLDTAKAWFTQNLQIGIPVAIVAGLLGILILWFLCRSLYRCCAGGRKDLYPTQPMMGQMPAQHQRLGSMDSQRSQQQAQGW
ncbi:Zinc metalloprotease [Mycena chlorophos]|uniref:Disintegrin and metalloproteinase domain-containing protein B n=1 Tax=Mycena chlorophos TaxID=658473 RepID=A0A8H6T4W3_MYCCL|nr:Zinc metalloprotease [Mycena chlorophos]